MEPLADKIPDADPGRDEALRLLVRRILRQARLHADDPGAFASVLGGDDTDVTALMGALSLRGGLRARLVFARGSHLGDHLFVEFWHPGAKAWMAIDPNCARFEGASWERYERVEFEP